MLHVEAVVTVRVERTGTLDVGRDVVAGLTMVSSHPLHAFHRLGVTTQAGAGAAGDDELGRGGVPAGICSVGAAGNRAIPVLAGAAAVVRVVAVEAIAPLGQCRGVAFRRVARGGVGGDLVEHDLTADDGHGGVFVTGDDRFHAHEDGQVAQTAEVFSDGVLVFLDGLPAPHGRAALRGKSGAVAGVALDRGGADAVRPSRGRALAFNERVGRRAERGVFHERAIAVAVAAVAGLHEPVEAPRRVRGVGGLLDDLLQRDGTVGAGGVVVEVAGDVLAALVGAGLLGIIAIGDRGSEAADENGRHGRGERREVQRVLHEGTPGVSRMRNRRESANTVTVPHERAMKEW